MSRIAVTLITTLLCIFYALPRGWSKSAHQYLTVVESGSQRVIFSLRPFEIEVSAFTTGEQAYQRVQVAGFGLSSRAGAPELPQTGALLRIPRGANVSVAVLESSFEELTDIRLAPTPKIDQDLATGAVSYSYLEVEAFYASDSFSPTSLARLSDRRDWQGSEIGRIEINPVQYNPLRQILRIYKSLTVQVTFSRPLTRKTAVQPKHPNIVNEWADDVLLNSEYFDTFLKPAFKLKQPSNWYDPQTTYYKLGIDQEGIYALTYEELISAGVSAGALGLETLKIFNEGRQIPLWIDGPQGTTLDPENTVYFYGDRNRGDSTNYNLFSDENVYWLTSDGERGERYRLVEDAQQPASTSPFYWHSARIEIDSLFFRWDGNSTLATGEGWVWRYLFDNEREVTHFAVSGLYDAISACSLRVRVQGTTKTATNPDHHVTVSINNEIVGEAFFDDREERLLEASFPTTLIHNGANRFELHLVPDTGAEINQIALDWVEIEFPRVLGAANSQLKFESTAPTNTITAYTLVSFLDPEIKVFDPGRGKFWSPGSGKLSHYTVESAGFSDGNYVRISADFEVYEFRSRGHNLVTIDPSNGAVTTKSFDTYASVQEADAMADFLNALPAFTVVLAGIMDEGSAKMTEKAHQALEGVGSALTRQVESRDSWALIGWKGASPDSAKETLSRRFNGPAILTATLGGEQAFRFRAAFKDTVQAASFYYAASAQAINAVSRIEREENSDLRATTNGADYIIITHENFKREAEVLADYRNERNGFRTLVVDVQDVFDEFSYGLIDPHAIRDFLQYASTSWQKPGPSFVVLLGDASWDPKGIMAETTKSNFVPTYGDPVADNWFVSFDDQDGILPSMFLGRIPVETAEQAEVLIDKIISYEALPYDSWNKEFIFFNGGANASEQRIFLAQANSLISSYVETAQLQGTAEKFNKTTEEAITVSLFLQAIDRIHRGALWVNFLGHGAGSVWDISIGQPEDWDNDRIFPFITGMSCHSARFANPFINSLSEEYVLNPMGAAAYWGSTGFGFITQDFILLDGLLSAVVDDKVRTVGEATARAKVHLWQVAGENFRNRMVINQYTIIGDPALELKLPTRPELAVRSGEISLDRDLLLVSDSTASVSAQVRNYGPVPDDSVDVRFESRDPDGQITTIADFTIAPVGLTDSLKADWNLPSQPGRHDLRVLADPSNLIEEEDTANNVGEKPLEIYASDVISIKPMDAGVVTSAGFELVANNSRIDRANLDYFFEIDTTAQFTSPALVQSPSIDEGVLTTRWRPPLGGASGVYFWRVRTFDGSNFGPWISSSFTASPSGDFQWLQARREQFLANSFERARVSQRHKIILQQNGLVFRAESAGLLDGNYALLSLQKNVVGLNKRGHNLAVFDQSDAQFLGSASFDTWQNSANADSMADFIEQLPGGRLVLAAIRDEGSRSMTERAYLALESLGSALTRQVGIRDSWAMMGRKGAAIGSVPEAIKLSGQGPVVVVDSLLRFERLGRVVSKAIGPALRWRSFEAASNSPGSSNSIEFQILGRRKATGGLDTLTTALTGAPTDLSYINAESYPELKLLAVLVSEDGRSTPELDRWAVNFVPAPDLVVGRGSVQTSSDTVSIGADVHVNLQVGNSGLTPADSFDVTLSSTTEAGPIELARARVGSIAVDELVFLETSIPTRDLPSQARITVVVDSDDALVELSEANNDVAFSVWVSRDSTAPSVRLTLDGQEVSHGDFVAANPQVVVEIRDPGDLVFSDTSQVTIFLDERSVAYGLNPGQAQLIPQQDPQDPDLKATTVFQPQLTQGEHTLEVFARDEANNLSYFQVQLQVNEAFLIANVMNYPNPFASETEFTYVLTQQAEAVVLKIYTISGRLIHELDFLPTRVGFNQFLWDGHDRDGDTLGNGVYLYKIIARKEEEQIEVVEKFAVVR